MKYGDSAVLLNTSPFVAGVWKPAPAGAFFGVDDSGTVLGSTPSSFRTVVELRTPNESFNLRFHLVCSALASPSSQICRATFDGMAAHSNPMASRRRLVCSASCVNPDLSIGLASSFSSVTHLAPPIRFGPNIIIHALVATIDRPTCSSILAIPGATSPTSDSSRRAIGHGAPDSPTYTVSSSTSSSSSIGLGPIIITPSSLPSSLPPLPWSRSPTRSNLTERGMMAVAFVAASTDLDPLDVTGVVPLGFDDVMTIFTCSLVDLKGTKKVPQPPCSRVAAPVVV
ncbi:unnamed protein product [Phytophthora fragariaefolia]|uniref:Unnamed protein product n=1 Tax=Phytophthora fragariaefolia TaxID=1490495 RepID=A0A9W6YIC0_9STRA|nr:unnamed protein product [Phytophthora fragariaefolia]